MVEDGIYLLKYWLEISMEEQTHRFEQRSNDGRKIRKLSPMDLEPHRRWYDYSHILNKIPYKESPKEDIVLPQREGPERCHLPDHDYKVVPQLF